VWVPYRFRLTKTSTFLFIFFIRAPP
jgi:hypothetical protein